MVSDNKRRGSFRLAMWAVAALTFALLLSQPGRVSAQSSNVTTPVPPGGTINKIPKWTATSALGDSVVAESSGNVGIGTTNPTQLLHIRKDQNAGTLAYVENGIAGTAAQADVRVVNNLGILGQLGVYSSTSSAYGAASASDVHVYASSSLVLMADAGSGVIKIATGGNSEKIRIDSAGNVGIGTTAPGAYKLAVAGAAHVTGDLVVDGNVAAKYQDVAEWVPARGAIAAGTVVVLDTERSNHVVPSARAYDTRVAGVVSANPGVILGEGGNGKVMVATTGRVKIKVDATAAPIRVGDLLVTSDKEGVAMRSMPLDLGGTPIHRPGTLIGKALEPLDKGVGEILVLLSLQ